MMNNLTLYWFTGIALNLLLLRANCQVFDVDKLEALKAQFLPAEFRNRNFTLDDAKLIFREKCKKASGVDNSTVYQDIEQGASALMECFSNLANVTAIQEEIERARPIGELDTVFEKYCTKEPLAEQCLRDFNVKIQPCLSTAEKLQNAVMLRVATGLLGFMCAKGGDHIALFVAEDGPECLEANKDAINRCMNSSFAEFLPSRPAQLADLHQMPELVFKPEHCMDLQRFETCTVHHLEQCRELTPANVAESVFRFIRNETSCDSWLNGKPYQRSVLRQSSENSASPLDSGFMLMVGSWLCVMVLGHFN